MKASVYCGSGKRALEDKPKPTAQEPKNCVAEHGHSSQQWGERVEEKKVVVGEYENEIDAEIARGHLEASGITAAIFKDDGGGMFPSLQNTDGVQLLVSESQGEKARKVLQAKPH